MSIITVISDKTLANPSDGPPLPYGVAVEVDDSDPYIASLLDAGNLIVVNAPTAQTWDDGSQDPIVSNAPTDLAQTTAQTPQPEQADSEQPNERWARTDLDNYAHEHGVDPSQYSTKAELVEAIHAAG